MTMRRWLYVRITMRRQSHYRMTMRRCSYDLSSFCSTSIRAYDDTTKFRPSNAEFIHILGTKLPNYHHMTMRRWLYDHMTMIRWYDDATMVVRSYATERKSICPIFDSQAQCQFTSYDEKRSPFDYKI